MAYQIKVNEKKEATKKYLFQLYVATGSSLAALLSYFFYKDLTFVFLIINMLSIVQLLRDKIFEDV